MPVYEYACKACGQHVEVAQSFSDDPLTVCEACGGPLRKVFGSIGVVLKGSGFYRTDSRVPSGKPARSDSKSDTKAEPKGESKGGSKGESKGGSKGDGKSEAGEAKAGSSGTKAAAEPAKSA